VCTPTLLVSLRSRPIQVGISEFVPHFQMHQQNYYYPFTIILDSKFLASCCCTLQSSSWHPDYFPGGLSSWRQKTNQLKKNSSHSKSKLLDIIVLPQSILQFCKADQVGRYTRNLISESSCFLVFNASNPSIMTKQCSEPSHSWQCLIFGDCRVALFQG
jgi:hypothetical protein